MSAMKAPSTAVRDLQRLNPLNYIAYGGGDSANNLAFSLAMSLLALYPTDVGQVSASTVAPRCTRRRPRPWTATRCAACR